jgi:hypothetical protein
MGQSPHLSASDWFSLDRAWPGMYACTFETPTQLATGGRGSEDAGCWKGGGDAYIAGVVTMLRLQHSMTTCPSNCGSLHLPLGLTVAMSVQALLLNQPRVQEQPDGSVVVAVHALIALPNVVRPGARHNCNPVAAAPAAV